MNSVDQYPERGFGDGFRTIRLVLDFFQPVDQENRVERAMALLHPEVQVLGAPGIGPGRGYDGRDDFNSYFTETSEQGVWIDADASGIRISPSGAVLVAATLKLTGPHGSDTTPAWFVLTFRDGLIASIETHLDQLLAEEALDVAA